MEMLEVERKWHHFALFTTGAMFIEWTEFTCIINVPFVVEAVLFFLSSWFVQVIGILLLLFYVKYQQHNDTDTLARFFSNW